MHEYYFDICLYENWQIQSVPCLKIQHSHTFSTPQKIHQLSKFEFGCILPNKFRKRLRFETQEAFRILLFKTKVDFVVPL